MKERESKPKPAGYTEPAGIWGLVALFFSGMWSGVCGGLIAVILLPVIAFILGWIGGVGASGFPMRGQGPSVTPLGLEAAKNALGNAFLIGFLGGLPIFAIGAFIGGIVGIVKGIRRR